MGVWGAGLYAGDFALDMRANLSAITKLPFDGDELLEILCDLEPEIANDPSNEDYSSFWLVIADQFLKRGIICPRATLIALQIIDDDIDINVLSKLGMQNSDLRKRKKMLSALRISLAQSPTKKRGAVLNKPHEYQLDVGDIVVYPTSHGQPRNPYASDSQLVWFNWKQDGWRAAIVVDRGKAFEFLPWYTPLVAVDTFVEKPSCEQLQTVRWANVNPGTLSANHCKKMSIEKIQNLSIDPDKLDRVFPGMYSGHIFAVQDISIANSLGRSFSAGWENFPNAPRILSNWSEITK